MRIHHIRNVTGTFGGLKVISLGLVIVWMGTTSSEDLGNHLLLNQLYGLRA